MERYQISSDGAVYYVTFTLVQWLPLFVREEPCKIITDSLGHCIRNNRLLVGAYVIMPTHLHAVLADHDTNYERLSETIDAFRKFTGRALADYCDRSGPPAFKLAIRDEATADRNRRVWQPSKHPEIVYSDHFLTTKVTYLHNNPVRAGLVESADHWRFSSAAHYASDGREGIRRAYHQSLVVELETFGQLCAGSGDPRAARAYLQSLVVQLETFGQLYAGSGDPRTARRTARASFVRGQETRAQRGSTLCGVRRPARSERLSPIFGGTTGDLRSTLCGVRRPSHSECQLCAGSGDPRTARAYLQSLVVQAGDLRSALCGVRRPAHSEG